MIVMDVGGAVLEIEAAQTEAAAALEALLKGGSLPLALREFAHMEKFARLPAELPSCDEMMTAAPGDVMLSEGNLLVIYYAPNTWRFTRLGRVVNCPPDELKRALGPSDAAAVLSLR